jgi:hypothetical protein
MSIRPLIHRWCAGSPAVSAASSVSALHHIEPSGLLPHPTSCPLLVCYLPFRSTAYSDIHSAGNCPHPPVGARTAAGRGWRLAEACVQERVQSRAYAPPQCPPTRSPPITRDTNTTVPAAHTLTRVGGAKPPRHGRQPPHSEDGQRSPPLWRLSPSYLHHTPRPPVSWHGSDQEAPKDSAARQG